jgi:hypothetical protein
MIGSTQAYELLITLKARDKHVRSVLPCGGDTYVVAFAVPRDVYREGIYLALQQNITGDAVHAFVHEHVRKYLNLYLVAKTWKLLGMNYRVITSGVNIEPALSIPGLDVPMIEFSTNPYLREINRELNVTQFIAEAA